MQNKTHSGLLFMSLSDSPAVIVEVILEDVREGKTHPNLCSCSLAFKCFVFTLAFNICNETKHSHRQHLIVKICLFGFKVQRCNYGMFF